MQQLSDRAIVEPKDEIKLVLLLNELRENVQNNVKVYDIGMFLAIYCAYLYSMLFSISGSTDMPMAKTTNELNK